MSISVNLDDANGDSSLDITVWGVNTDGNNCLYPLIQNNSQFLPNLTNALTFPATTQPSLFETNIPLAGTQVRTNCLLIFNGGQRMIIYYSQAN